MSQYKDNIEIKSNRELIKSLFLPIKNAYTEISTKENLDFFESAIRRLDKFEILDCDGYPQINLWYPKHIKKTEATIHFEKVFSSFGKDELEKLFQLTPLFFNLIYLKMVTSQTPPVKCKDFSGIYVKLNNQYFLANVDNCYPYSKCFQFFSVPRIKGKTPISLSPIAPQKEIEIEIKSQ